MYSFAFVGAVFFTWFPPDDESPYLRLQSVTTRVTDPLVVPLRRVLRPASVGSISFDYVLIIYMFLFGSIIPGILGCYGLG